MTDFAHPHLDAHILTHSHTFSHILCSIFCWPHILTHICWPHILFPHLLHRQFFNNNCWWPTSLGGLGNSFISTMLPVYSHLHCNESVIKYQMPAPHSHNMAVPSPWPSSLHDTADARRMTAIPMRSTHPSPQATFY